MLDLEVSKLALIGAVALVVIGPEKLPRVARTLGTLLGKARRYVSDVKNEVNRSMEMEDLKKMKETMDTAMTDVQSSVLNATTQLNQGIANMGLDAGPGNLGLASDSELPKTPTDDYKHPQKNWRLKRSAMPHWYKARQGVRTRALSGAARVARFRPPSSGSNPL
ncbi:MAG: Sec-independent protein translocase subunit TatB [Betaproteobacteria bacterium]|nr:Sec-independent protein translocase subunit TatB [Betaproteobacteria bacterium]